MSGHRIRKGQPKQSQQRAQRRQASLAYKLTGASTPLERITIAADFVRGAVKVAPPDVAQQVSQYLVDQLIDAGNHLLATSVNSTRKEAA
ncbi:hypothetical protein [Stackebrandtia nassauensis]|uniref:Uncharacterized protein n=1 Tax=Stackebrandtia nassauensis (strain DSM 44728 / CIP 108903 / NRRL B-16338 / NBRC 102104 / LLR-40K-21) TaxID=446470 RepID=D3Q2X3_STANL|nr:hypothetical protein [Stackebrandtia nassauensis]ADD45874.1 hypothetical protein Snas_6254 [Stackebrandtia nassauensis DSM 44728]